MIFEDFKDRLVNMGYSYSTYDLPTGHEYIFELPKVPNKSVNFFFCRYREDTDYLEYYTFYDNVDSGRVAYLSDMDSKDLIDLAATVHLQSYEIYVIRQKEEEIKHKKAEIEKDFVK